MKKLFEILRLKWAEYLLEIIVITIGILAAFLLNNWNENRLQKTEEIKALTELLEGIKNDKIDIQFNINISEQVIESSDIILKSFETNNEYDDSLAQHFSGAFRTTRFVGNQGPYEALKAKGLEIISNDSLRSQIIRMHDFNYEGIDNFESGFFVPDNFIRQGLVKYFNVVEPYTLGPGGLTSGSMKPHDYTSLKKDKEFRTLLLTFRAQTKLYGIAYNERVISELEILIENIEDEINRLEIG